MVPIPMLEQYKTMKFQYLIPIVVTKVGKEKLTVIISIYLTHIT